VTGEEEEGREGEEGMYGEGVQEVGGEGEGKGEVLPPRSFLKVDACAPF